MATKKQKAKHLAIKVIAKGIKEAREMDFDKPYDQAIFAVVALQDAGIEFRHARKEKS